MIIILSPQASSTDDTPPSVSGDILTYRNVEYDLTPLANGGQINLGAPFIGTVRRVGGVVHCVLQYTYDWSTSEDHQSLNWADYTFDVVDGVCPCPIIRK